MNENPFGAAALLIFDTITLTPKQGKGIAVPYCFGYLFLFSSKQASKQARERESKQERKLFGTSMARESFQNWKF